MGSLSEEGGIRGTKMNKELSANSNLSHYRIVSQIGAGGMGEVYLAQDSHYRLPENRGRAAVRLPSRP